MNSRRSSMILITVTGLLSLAWGPGGAGTNGLDSGYYQGHKIALTDGLLKKPLPASSNTVPLRVAEFTGPAMGKTKGVLLVKDAIGCALSRAGSRTYGSEAFTGQDLMDLGDSWLNSALSVGQMNDVHTCLVARLNKFDVEVPIFLYGPHVRTTFPNYASYLYAEAVWLATVGDPTSVSTDVWPLEDLTRFCGNDLSKVDEAINLRVCGSTTACGVTVHHEPIQQKCNETPQGWRCTPPGGGDKLPTVATRLGPCAWKQIYAESHCPLLAAPPPAACAHGEP